MNASPARLRADVSEERAPGAHVSELAAASVAHRAVGHPYLEAMAGGSLPDPRWALRDFARHYFAYSRHFPRYLTAVISRLEDPVHRQHLLQNLSEEAGSYSGDELEELVALGVDPAWIVGVPHPQLFRRFRAAMGADGGGDVEAVQVTCWRELFFAVLSHGSPAEAVGALGLGTEGIVRRIYQPFVTALARCPDLPHRDTAFFTVHVAVDDHHEATLLQIAGDFAATEDGRAGLRRGMLKALSLRGAFWDWLHQRALDPSRADEVV